MFSQGALSYAELGCIVKKSGGEYAYMYAAMGRVAAFLFAWTRIMIMTPSSVCIITLTFAQYLITFFPYCGMPDVPLKVIAATTIGLYICYYCWSYFLNKLFWLILMSRKISNIDLKC